MRAYSTDLKERLVRAVADDQPMRDAARRFGKQAGSTLPLPMRTEFRVPGLLKKTAEQFAAVPYIQFLIHMCAVRFHRIFADDQGRGNLPIALAAQEEFAHLALLPGEWPGNWHL